MADPASGDSLIEFLAVMRRLRAECPWKSAQTHRSLARYLLEETHETLEAIDRDDLPHLREELGDLLLQVYFHAVIAEQAGEFTIDDIAADITAKMRRRNPHVFGPDAAALTPGTAQEVDDTWQQIKAAEGAPSPLPETLPALLYAAKALERRARAGDPEPVLTDDLGDRLLALVVEANDGGVDPEQALRDAIRRLP